jgi:hypothetical protein
MSGGRAGVDLDGAPGVAGKVESRNRKLVRAHWSTGSCCFSSGAPPLTSSHLDIQLDDDIDAPTRRSNLQITSKDSHICIRLYQQSSHLFEPRPKAPPALPTSASSTGLFVLLA